MFLVALLVFSLASCGSGNDETSEFNANNVSLLSAYNEAEKLGFEGTLEEFIALISGKDGADGEDGKTPTVEISEDGYWVINGVKTDVKAQGEKGDKGDTGAQGVGIKSVEFDENRNLLITFTDNSTQTVEIPEKEEHVHSFGEWVEFGNSEDSYCEDNFFYNTCSECNYIEFKNGSYDDHNFKTVTTPPTCQAGGYDTKTCSICGKVEVCNETPIAPHSYPETYESTSEVHWLKCTVCTHETEQVEHSFINGICTVCDAVFDATLGEINYNVNKTAISVNDELNANLFSASCYYSDGRAAQVNVTYSGTVAAGETISVRLSVTDSDETKQVTIRNVKVYGAPELTYDESVSWVNIVSGLTPDVFSAVATDSFGEQINVTVSTEGLAHPGTLTTVVLTATDISGNKMVKTVENVKAYSNPAITYNTAKNYIKVSDILNAELFEASASDSFGKACKIVLSCDKIKVGTTQSIVITATDEVGNTKTETVTGVKIYGTPIVTIDEFIYDTTDISFIAIVKDSFGNELRPDISYTGELTDGNEVIVTVKATDSVGNNVKKTYKYIVNHSKHNWIDGYCSICDNECPYTLDGNYIYFGEYPQSIKADNVTISSTVDDRDYFLGSDGCYYAQVVANPYGSSYTFSTGASVTDGTTYYFKVEPIRWRILSEDGETALILCDSIIANHRYDDSSNNYASSEIRQWLNATFYETAFSELQRELILTTTVDNSVYSTGYSSNSYVCEDTNDKIFLLSYMEVTNSVYGFSSDNLDYDTACRITSDYSRAAGVWMTTDNSYYGNSYWWLRSPSRAYAVDARYVYYYGSTSTGPYNSISGVHTVNFSTTGVVPALRIRL